MRIKLALLILTCCIALRASAEPVRYALQPELSTVGFSYILAGDRISGQIPLKIAEITIDFDKVSQSSVRAVLDAAGADAGPLYADQAMHGDSVLATARFPEIVFASTKVVPSGSGALVSGPITIRGVTRPITLNASIFRQRGSQEGDRSRLTVVLRGTLKRSAFGAIGFGGLVADEISLSIVARIQREG